MRKFLTLPKRYGIKNGAMKTELYKCDVCGKVARLEAGKRHWCDCNARAPFPVYSVRSRRVSDYLSLIGKKGGQSKSSAKVRAARKNGKLGGRKKKQFRGAK